ncbi:hypothetical protein [Vagococcus hydrophili]|uniref:Uncharacterized protein n=1 Tax=Vagococcus hydrophili TaxID=2714947 RepID=A0A6G8APV8_9ENTE|nr:hypothetical protein [Vagococcus hydrophili]QIL47036.1 hypothetical protein G7082_00070 [Vagococcus hydrophili]
MSDFEEWDSEVYLKKRIVTEDDENNDIVSYSSEYDEISMDIQSAGGSESAQIWGEQLPYIKTCYYEGDKIKEGQNENDGICYKVGPNEEPDYEIKSIQEWDNHSIITLKKLVV